MYRFGIDRVIEPKNNTPVTAWKLDNSKKIKAGEILINVKKIVVERANLDQIANFCQFDVKRIENRILKIIEERGKFHNPYTKSSGLFFGICEEISPGFQFKNQEIKVGDPLICLAPMADIPLKIEAINNMDFLMGILDVEGYGVCFETGNLVKLPKNDEVDISYLLRALEEEGNFNSIINDLKCKKTPLKSHIIGSNLAEVILYSQVLKDISKDVEISLSIDKAWENYYTLSGIREILGDLIKSVHFIDIRDPIGCAKELLKKEKIKAFDFVINMSNISGSETMAAFIVKDGGLVYYTSLNNQYSVGVLVSDALNKNIENRVLDGFNVKSYDIAKDLVIKSYDALKRLEEFASRNKHRLFNIVSTHGQGEAKQVDGFAYKSTLTEKMVEEALNIAQYDCSVIIQGETGVGKEKVFNLIYENSLRKGEPCIRINCATIQENLAESEFFGYEKGAFTGAQSTGKIGYFEMADKGMLLLDEIGSLSLNMQSKLLRVLQESTYYKVGGTKAQKVDVRVICANNIPLKQLVDEGKFREDLFYRLNIYCINVPPLRNRKDDIEYLAEIFIKNYSKKYGKEKNFSYEAYRQLQNYNWPGNVRELENVVHRLYISEKSDVISEFTVGRLLSDSALDEAIFDIEAEFKNNQNIDFTTIIEKQEKALIQFALKKARTTRGAAELLGLPQTTLSRKKIKYGL